MPKIELVLPGAPKTQVDPVSGTYRITVERDDGVACTEIEAHTAMSMFCLEWLNRQPTKGRRRNAEG